MVWLSKILKMTYNLKQREYIEQERCFQTSKTMSPRIRKGTIDPMTATADGSKAWSREAIIHMRISIYDYL